NQAQFLRAQAAAAQHLGHNYNDQQHTTYVNRNPNGATTSTTTTATTSNGRH
ncbi:hypothetical protein BGX24_010384, partial [Mortierella sp. AD032]